MKEEKFKVIQFIRNLIVNIAIRNVLIEEGIIIEEKNVQKI